MSLDLINHKLTTSTIDSKGVTTWSNPDVDVTINSKGEVARKGVKLKTKQYKNQYNCRIKNDKGESVQACTSFNGLFSRIVLGEKLGVRTIRLKDEKRGYKEDNVLILSNRKGITKHVTNTSEVITATQDKLEVTVESEPEITKLDKTIKQYYTVYEAKNEHITEDGAVFPTRELAEWHQTNVAKGKGNAQIVLDYNGGYVLAEQIFLQEVKYIKEKPYVNFIDVMNNNSGVVSHVQEEHCVFDNLGDLIRIMNIGLHDVIGLKTTKFQAVKIQEALETYVKIEEEFNNSVIGLKALVKQVKL